MMAFATNTDQAGLIRAHTCSRLSDHADRGPRDYVTPWNWHKDLATSLLGRLLGVGRRGFRKKSTFSTSNSVSVLFC